MKSNFGNERDLLPIPKPDESPPAAPRLCGPEGYCNARGLYSPIARCPSCQAVEDLIQLWSRVVGE